MMIIRYVDIYKEEHTAEGIVDRLTVKDATLPILIDSTRVNSVQPYFSSKGKLFKNVSYINYDGELIKVVGNYKILESKIKDDTKDSRIQVKGYINGKR